MIDRTTDREIVEADGRLEFKVDGKVIFRMLLDEHGSEGGGTYAYRPDELVIDEQWLGVKANAELVNEYVDVGSPKERFEGGAVYCIKQENQRLRSMDVPEIFEDILAKANFQPSDSGQSGELVEPLPVTPHFVFVSALHGPPFGPAGPPGKLGTSFGPLPNPQKDQPGYPVRVGVVDSGCHLDHSWWGGRVNATPDDDEPNPDYDPGTSKRSVTSGHGTFINGVILRCAPGATIVSRRVVGGEFGEFDESKLVTVLNELANLNPPVDLINVSFGAYTPHGRIPLLLDAFLRGRQNGKPVVVAAAGNDSTNERHYPAAHPDVIGVGATEDTGERAGFSNYGWWVDAYAPGVNLRSTFIEWLKADGTPEDPAQGPWATWSGTSFAAPVVCGMIAATMRPSGIAGPSIDVVTAANQVLQTRRRPQDLGPLVEVGFVVSDPLDSAAPGIEHIPQAVAQ